MGDYRAAALPRFAGGRDGDTAAGVLDSYAGASGDGEIAEVVEEGPPPAGVDGLAGLWVVG